MTERWYFNEETKGMYPLFDDTEPEIVAYYKKAEEEFQAFLEATKGKWPNP